MKREIMFRCWNTTSGKMIDLYKATPLALDANLKIDGLFIPFGDTYILMQYTGLKDKNGVEIYEGDILTDGTIVDDYGTEFMGVVEFNDSAWRIGIHNCRCSEEHNLVLNDTSEYTIIGNIYEHPHLLTPTTSNNETK